MSTVPTIGRIVHYKLTEQDADAINKRRADAHENRAQIASDSVGYVAHTGNKATAGDVLPMLIVRCWGTTPESSVNGQVFLDGNDCLWVTSVSAGDGERQFTWPQAKPTTPTESEAR